MKKILTPRFIEPLAAALMGAGFFIFASALSGGSLWRGFEESLWKNFKGHPDVLPAEAVLIRGKGLSSLGVAQQRLALARDIDLLSASGAKLVVLEAWLDEPSQLESEEILADLLDSAKKMSKSSVRSLRAKVATLQTHLNADDTLAASMLHAGNVLLPVEVEAAPSPAPLSGTVWEKFRPYEVSRRGKGIQQLDAAWRPVRAPIDLFRSSAMGLALVTPPLSDVPDQPIEVPGVFQLRGKWVNGIGFDAARQALDVPERGQQFLWRQGELSAVELRGAQFPMTVRGGFWLPQPMDRAHVLTFDLPSLEGAPLLASLKGKIVFYQPWPELLVGEEGFARQRELCAAILAQRLQLQPEQGNGFWILIGFWLLLFVCFALLGWPWAPLLAPIAGLLLIGRFIQLQAPLAQPLGMLASAMFCGFGLSLILAKRRREERRLWLRGHVPPSAQKRWETLLPDPATGALVEGVYLGVHAADDLKVPQWQAWAERWDAFCEVIDSQTGGFFLPLGANEAYPLAQIQELRELLPEAGMSSVRGALGLAAEKVFDSVRWRLAGNLKQEALKLLSMTKAGSYFVSESDYLSIRQNVKIQLISETELSLGHGPKKIFNVLGVF